MKKAARHKLKWKRDPGSSVQAPLSHGHGITPSHDYVISHRTDQHTVSYRPPGQHEHVGTFTTEKEAKAAAEAHAGGVLGEKFPGARLADRPLADKGLISYRLRTPHGSYVMIGARDHQDAMREAARSTPKPDRAALEVWNGDRYVKAFDGAHARKKTPAELDRDIAESVAGCHACKHGRGHTSHATRAARPTPYRIKLTPSEMKAVEFAHGRYSWPDMLSAHAAEDGSVAFTESEMWQWTDDVDSDTEGNHSPFPLAAPAFAEKLQRFYDSRV